MIMRISDVKCELSLMKTLKAFSGTYFKLEFMLGIIKKTLG